MKRSGFTMMVVFFGAIGLLYVWMRVDLLRVGRDIERLKQQEVALEHRREALQLRFSQLTAPRIIAEAARSEFKLEMPRPGQVVMVATETAVATNQGKLRKPMEVAQRSLREE
ncbi:MAG: cell division protein FtsL [Nitrospirales bacterium]|nr:cell division protein FtsL [Nitrospira sp.]MDR4500472.1 cell division protein FtsL [Nitrospirales bacterium]